LMAACEGDMKKFYVLCDNGAVEPVANMFSELMGENMSPEVILQILKISDMQKQSAMEQRTLLKCTEEQFLTAMKLSIEEGDSIDDYRTLLAKNIHKLQNALDICTKLRPHMTAFHTRCNGAIDKVGALFSDMAPEPAKGKPLPPGMIHALLRIPKEATTCRVEDLIECFQRNMDENDSIEKMRPYLEKTY